MKQNIIPTAEPFFFPGNSTGCLLVHGFTGSPKEMRTLGEFLAQKGYTVLGIRLAGHATQLKDMQHCHWVDWLNSVEDGFHLLSTCKKRFVLGLSMGGILSLIAASRYPVDGVVAMSTLYEMPKDWRLNFLGVFKYLLPQISKGPSDWKDTTFEKEHIDYPVYPTSGIEQLKALTVVLKDSIKDVKCPTLLIHSKNDGGVAPENSQKIYNQLKCSEKEILWVENSGHIVTRDGERARVFQAIDDFIQKCQANNA